MKRLFTFATAKLIVLIAVGTLAAEVPHMINYQGVLHSGGSPVTDPVTVVFAIWNTEMNGDSLWSEIRTIDPSEDGAFSIMLGEITGIDDSVFSESSRWLSIKVEDDPEISPRTELSCVPFAFRISTIDGAVGGSISGDISISGRATIGAGNVNNSPLAFVAGGSNLISSECDAATIGGGEENAATGKQSVVGGGHENRANARYATVSGGHADTAYGWGSVVGGGEYNISNGDYSVVSGGAGNRVDNTMTAIGGGGGNLVQGAFSTIPGGYCDTISSDASYSYLFGIGSLLTQDSTFMVDLPHIRFGDEAAGYEIPNTDGSDGQVLITNGSGQVTWVTPGYLESCNWHVSDSVLSTNNYWGITRGGAGNMLLGDSTNTHMNLGVGSQTGGYYSTIAGGVDNSASGSYTTIGGGEGNYTGEPHATVCGGKYNAAESEMSVTCGGWGNWNNGFTSFIGAGQDNLVNGNWSAILGGNADTIDYGADYSYLFGIGSKLTQDSTFMVDMPHIRFGDENDGYEFPEADGADGQILVTDGTGNLSWSRTYQQMDFSPYGYAYFNDEADILHTHSSATSGPGYAIHASVDNGSLTASAYLAGSDQNLPYDPFAAMFWGDVWLNGYLDVDSLKTDGPVRIGPTPEWWLDPPKLHVTYEHGEVLSGYVDSYHGDVISHCSILDTVGTDGWALIASLNDASANEISARLAGRFGPVTYAAKFKGDVEVRGEIEVLSSSKWPDYVFESDYRLMSIDELGDFVQEHKHLPDLESAETMESEGVKLGTMQAKLLKKIEELTLYVIQVSKENDRLNERLRMLEEHVRQNGGNSHE